MKQVVPILKKQSFWLDSGGMLIAIGLLLFYLDAPPALAQSDTVSSSEIAEGEAALDDTRKKIDREESRLEEIRKREQELRTSLEGLQSEGEKAKKASAVLSAALNGLEAERRELSATIDQAKEKSSQLQIGLRERIAAIYKTHRRSASVDYLFRSTSATDLLKRAYYLESVARFDHSYLEQLGAVVTKLEHDRQRLALVQTERAAKLEEVRTLEKQIEERSSKQASLLREERKKAEQREKALEKLRASAARLERVMAGIMGSEEAPLPKEVKIIAAMTRRPTPPKSLPSVPGIVEPPEPVRPVPFTGGGLASQKGKLEFPVPGRIIQRFGKQQHEEFADILFVKGLEVHAPVGALVRAVAGGKVIFNKSLPGYGKVLILDHGQRYYTLYGRIASAKKEVGAVVQEGEVLAELGNTDGKGRNFYFELRIKGRATDPTSYFTRLPNAG
jgi:septal ring factor EnvC (AmiA/AmiB activator)